MTCRPASAASKEVDHAFHCFVKAAHVYAIQLGESVGPIFLNWKAEMLRGRVKLMQRHQQSLRMTRAVPVLLVTWGSAFKQRSCDLPEMIDPVRHRHRHAFLGADVADRLAELSAWLAPMSSKGAPTVRHSPPQKAPCGTASCSI